MNNGRAMNYFSIILAACICALTFGCEKPIAEMKRAEEAIDKAKRSESALCSTAEISAAEKAYKEGLNMMDTFRYNSAKQRFEDAYSKATMVQNARCKRYPAPSFEGPAARRVRDRHTVVSGECLWYISEYSDIYGDPFQWPIIYDANRGEIDSTAHSKGHYYKEEDHIYPGQVFEIPRDSSIGEIKDARKRAGAPAPYAPPGR